MAVTVMAADYGAEEKSAGSGKIAASFLDKPPALAWLDVPMAPKASVAAMRERDNFFMSDMAVLQQIIGSGSSAP